ncbi:hypothetical protein B0H19DRAFT_1084572 [Mycena capillaripes]|nr:hypothetical protein B0H19DRAFT_1084572 [Mycena capillaripes]
MRPAAFALLLCSLFVSFCFTAAHSVGADTQAPEATVCVYDRRSALEKRADGDSGTGDGGVGVTLPSVGLTLGNITTKLGNINLTVTNVTISVGSIDIENIEIGNITIIVSVPLPGASPINAFSASSAASSIATSTSTGTSTVSPPVSVSQTASSDAGFLQRVRRQQDSSLPPTTTTSGIGLPTVTVGGGDVSAGAGNVDTEIGNITIFVGNVNVSVGDVKIKNVTIGNIFVLVQIGQPDLTGALGNLTNALEGTNPSS